MKNNLNGDPDAPVRKDQHDQSIEPNFDDDFSDFSKNSQRVSITNRSSLKPQKQTKNPQSTKNMNPQSDS